MYKKGAILILVIISFFLGRYIEKTVNSSMFEEKNIHSERAGTGYLINPLLECELSTIGSNQKYIPFEKETKNRIENEVLSQNKDLQFSLYFRNLRNGPWFGINEDAEFAPASLMKLPISLAYMKWSEYYPELATIAFTGVVDDDGDIQNIIPEKTVIAGKTYSLIDLISLALIYSDNNANQTLLAYLPKDTLYKVFNDLSLPIIDKLEAGENDYINVREYASFFRILYNASYLSDTNSTFLLEILTQSTLKGGIRASIPSEYMVAHKFGERRIPNPDFTYTSQFHDCGIVYYPKYPYIVCIMTKGDDNIPRLQGITEKVSGIIFDEIRKRY